MQTSDIKKKPHKVILDVKGPAVDWLVNIKDDNDAEDADTQRMIDNFDCFADDLIAQQKEFLTR